MKEFKIRCSAIGQIMPEPKAKKDLLSKSAQTYCQNWLTEQITGQRKEFYSKEMLKGILVEKVAIDFIADQLGFGMLDKNEEWFEDEHMTGTPDVITPKFIIDNKSPWDAYTMPMFETELPNKDYYWQGQGYMELCKKPLHKVIYTLMDTPDVLVERELRSYCFNNGLDIDDVDMDEFRQKFRFGHIAPEYRLRQFDVPHDNYAIDKIRERVEQCRMYIKTLLK